MFNDKRICIVVEILFNIFKYRFDAQNKTNTVFLLQKEKSTKQIKCQISNRTEKISNEDSNFHDRKRTFMLQIVSSCVMFHVQ